MSLLTVLFLGAITATTADGNTIVKGGAGNDTLTGASGIDTISGGAGDDAIDGKAGVDIMTGGAGKDTFKAVIGGNTAVTAITDKVTDFEVGVDKLDLTVTVAAVDKASTDVAAGVSVGLLLVRL